MKWNIKYFLPLIIFSTDIKCKIISDWTLSKDQQEIVIYSDLHHQHDSDSEEQAKIIIEKLNNLKKAETAYEVYYEQSQLREDYLKAQAEVYNILPFLTYHNELGDLCKPVDPRVFVRQLFCLLIYYQMKNEDIPQYYQEERELFFKNKTNTEAMQILFDLVDNTVKDLQIKVENSSKILPQEFNVEFDKAINDLNELKIKFKSIDMNFAMSKFDILALLDELIGKSLKLLDFNLALNIANNLGVNKIIIFAGFLHIPNLINLLSILGYKITHNSLPLDEELVNLIDNLKSGKSLNSIDPKALYKLSEINYPIKDFDFIDHE